jgi:hypothetical protein
MCKSTTDNGTDDTAEWQTVFFDDFNRSDGAAGNNYTVQVEGGSGTFSISNNMLELSGGVYYAIRYANDVTSDVIKVSVKCSTMTAPSDDYAFSVVAKSSNLGNGYGGAVWAAKDSISIFKMTGGEQPSHLISDAFEIQENRSYLLEFTVADNNLIFIVTDLTTGISEPLNTTDTGSPLTGGTVSINGIQSDEDIIYFDDFKIEKFE